MDHSDRTIARHLEESGVSRRDFLRLCSALMVTAPAALALTNDTVEGIAKKVGAAKRPSVIWLHAQDCTGCTETLLRTSAPDVAHLILDVISLDYHETLMAASGDQAEAALRSAMVANAGKYVLVVEGSIPAKDDGKYLEVAKGQRGIAIMKEVAANAAAIIAIGSCASWGGVGSAGPNPTGATGVDSIITDKPIVNLPGCPPNPYTLLAVVLEYATMGKLPELDAQKRPKFAYSRVIHENCPRRAHFDAGRFALAFGDDGHKQGWCLYKLGCKGPVTHAACATRHFNEVPDVWPIGIGAPCVGCTEKDVVWNLATVDTVPIHAATPPDQYPPIYAGTGHIGAIASGIVGVVAGAAGGAAWVASQRFQSSTEAGKQNMEAERKETPAGGK